jgi:PDZ domain
MVFPGGRVAERRAALRVEDRTRGVPRPENCFMLKGLAFAVAGLLAGLAIAFFTQREPLGDAPAARQDAASPRGTRADEPSSRVAGLEAALDAEVAKRAALEARVDDLAATLDELQGESPSASGPALSSAEDSPVEETPRQRFRPDPAASRADLARRQVDRLVAAGFAPDRAEWINRRTSELRMEQLNAQYEAQREGKPPDPATFLQSERTLRSELGDADYERYLAAMNRPTSVPVQGVLASSPAERLGLQAGDEIVAYDGNRVFDMRELNALTYEGTAGESVVVDVRRDGQTIQVVMPRGPIGIFGGGFRGR